MDGQGSVMYVGSEGWPVWSDPTDELLWLKLLKKLMLVPPLKTATMGT